MSEVSFYHYRENVGMDLLVYLEQVRTSGWKAVVRCHDDAEVNRVTDMLWQQYGTRFIGLGAAGTEHDADQNILVCKGDNRSNQPDCLVALGRSRIDPAEIEHYRKIALMFSSSIDVEISEARRQWKDLSATGIPLRYYVQSSKGWQMKGEANT